MPCFCGDTVVTTPCSITDAVADDGMHGKRLIARRWRSARSDARTLTGKPALGPGLSIAQGGTLQGGTVHGFRTGVRVVSETAAAA